MVETKTQKRKAAARSVARASHENAKAEAAKKASPVSSTSRATRPAARSNTESQPKAANISRKMVKKPADIVEDASVKEPNFEDILPELQADDEESADDDGSGEDEFTSQRLVVRLTPKQEKKLEDGLDKLKTAAKAKTAPSPATKSDSKTVDHSSGRKSAVVYIGRIPYGFFESEMRAYFSQFGEVLRLRLSRNKLTGKSKHYAFIEFAHPEVADIVSETHNNMLMCDRLIKCSVVPIEKIHPTMWIGSDNVYKAPPTKEHARKAVNRKRTRDEEEKRVERLVAGERKRRQKLEAAGIEYDFPGYEALRDAGRPKRTKFVDE